MRRFWFENAKLPCENENPLWEKDGVFFHVSWTYLVFFPRHLLGTWDSMPSVPCSLSSEFEWTKVAPTFQWKVDKNHGSSFWQHFYIEWLVASRFAGDASFSWVPQEWMNRKDQLRLVGLKVSWMWTSPPMASSVVEHAGILVVILTESFFTKILRVLPVICTRWSRNRIIRRNACVFANPFLPNSFCSKE